MLGHFDQNYVAVFALRRAAAFYTEACADADSDAIHPYHVTGPIFSKYMHPDWQTFLQRQGAVFRDGRAVGFGHDPGPGEAAGHAVVLTDLSGSEGCIAVSGPERQTFLQGQLSTDIRRLTAEISQFSSWNSAKGRVVAILRVCEQGEALSLTLPRTLLDAVISGLRLHVLRSKVTLTDNSDHAAAFGVAGEPAPQLLEDCGYRAPGVGGGVTSKQGIQLTRLPGALPRLAVHGEVSGLQELWCQLCNRGARPAGNDTWTLQRILAGEPCIHPATSGHFVAQMLGLEELGAVHFNKGCYLGQEVIARAHYRGTVKRHLHRASCESAGAVLPGMEVMDTTRSAAAGEVVDAARDTDRQWQLLLVLHDESVKSPLSINGCSVHLIA